MADKEEQVAQLLAEKAREIVDKYAKAKRVQQLDYADFRDEFAALLRPHLEPDAQSSGTVSRGEIAPFALRSSATAEKSVEYSPSTSEAPAARHSEIYGAGDSSAKDGPEMGDYAVQPKGEPTSAPSVEGPLREIADKARIAAANSGEYWRLGIGRELMDALEALDSFKKQNRGGKG